MDDCGLVNKDISGEIWLPQWSSVGFCESSAPTTVVSHPGTLLWSVWRLANSSTQVDQVLPGHYNTFGAKRLHRIASAYISRAGTCPAKFSTFAWRTLAGAALRACNPRSVC